MKATYPSRIYRTILCSAIALLLGMPVALPAGSDPTTLMLTWQRDPTTTMTLQWLDRGEPLPLMPGTKEVTAHRHHVPKLASSALDAQSAWKGPALEVPRLTNTNHVVPDEETFGAALKLGWTDAGLRVRVNVYDLTPSEETEIQDLWRGDSVELFISTGVGERQRYQLALTAGADPDHPKPRMQVYDHRAEPVGEIEATYEAVVREDGYTLDVILPWENLGLETVESGMTLGFQVAVNNAADGARKGDVIWHPGRDSSFNPNAMVALQLAEQPDAPVRVRVLDKVDDTSYTVRVLGDAEVIGQRVSIHAGDQVLADAELAKHEALIEARLDVPAPPEGYSWGTLEVRLNDELISTVTAPRGHYSAAPGPAELIYHREGEDERHRVETKVSKVEQWPGGMYRQRVELTGLEPATAYYFQIPGSDRTFYFRTMPVDANKPIRFAIGGDTRHNQAMMEQTNRQAMRYDIEFVVWGGDFAYADGHPERVYRWEEWFDANYNTLIAEDGRVIPIIGAIGNHEVRGGSIVRRRDYDGSDTIRQQYAPFFYQLFAFPGQPGYAVLDFADYLSVIALDSHHTNPITGDQAAWLEAVLKERQHVPHVFPVYHVPAYPSARDYDAGISVAIRNHWVPLFERYGIEVAFENHDHTYKRTHPIREGEVNPHQGIVYMGDGAWGVGTRAVHNVEETWYLKRAESIRHAIIMTLHGQHRHMLVVSEHGDIIDEYPATPPEHQ